MERGEKRSNKERKRGQKHREGREGTKKGWMEVERNMRQKQGVRKEAWRKG